MLCPSVRQVRGRRRNNTDWSSTAFLPLFILASSLRGGESKRGRRKKGLAASGRKETNTFIITRGEEEGEETAACWAKGEQGRDKMGKLADNCPPPSHRRQTHSAELAPPWAKPRVRARVSQPLPRERPPRSSARFPSSSSSSSSLVTSFPPPALPRFYLFPSILSSFPSFFLRSQHLV